MKKIQLFKNPLTENQIAVGSRLLFASLVLILGAIAGRHLWLAAMLLAGIVLSFPSFGLSKYNGRLAEGPQSEELLEKIKKQNTEQYDKFKKEIVDLTNQGKAGMIDEKTFNAKFDEWSKRFEIFDKEAHKKLVELVDTQEKKLAEQNKALVEQGVALKKMQETGLGNAQKGIHPLRAEIKKIMESEDYKAFVNSNGTKSAKFELKTVSVTSDYTGDSLVHITTRDSRIVDHPQMRKLNIRNLITVQPTDLPYLAFLEVYEWVRAAATVSENGVLPESSFKVRESTISVKRIGTHVPISKRMLKSNPFVEGHLVQRLPAQVRFYEDFQILFGDGQGENLTGIFQVADNFATIINTAVSGAAGSVSSIASYANNDKTLVTFAAAQNINNGDIISFGGGAGANYTGDMVALVVSPTKIVVEKNYVADADTSDWTFEVASKFKNSVHAAQQIDVLKIAKTLVTRMEYSCTGIILHPDDATLIELLKGNDEHYLDVQRLENGVMTIAGVPVVETTAMPSGKFAVGDWALACALLEFTTLQLEFTEDVTTKLANYVEAIIHEEVLFPIYNRYMFLVGDFSTSILAISAESES